MAIKPHRHRCDACAFSAWDGDEERLWCRKGQPGCPEIGDWCRGFERYPGAEPIEEKR